jgi:glycosyltransferase involved in cell wall biosynthesis
MGTEYLITGSPNQSVLPIHSAGNLDSGYFVSVIICTYGRSTALRQLLNALRSQTYSGFEVLVIDGNGEASPARQIVDEFIKTAGPDLDITRISSSKGLTRQRNVGLQAAKGNLLCFLDDDVNFAPDFLEKVVRVFASPGTEFVGGITAYDTLNYAVPVTLRWRLRAALGVMPGLDPGAVDRLGRAVPISFLEPWQGNREIGWLPGFCMIYRTAAVAGLSFDEGLETYAGEDRDFSMRVSKPWRLLICGDLPIRHECTAQGRDSSLERLRQSSFGVGRRFAKYAKGAGDYPVVATTVLGDLIVDLLALAGNPSRMNFDAIFVRWRAFWAGFKSIKSISSLPKTGISNSFGSGDDSVLKVQ